MSSSASKLEPSPAGSTVSGFGPHIEELHAFFKTRGVGFGSAEDLQPFVKRLDGDAMFREEMGSTVRTIIYRERDGLSWIELMELVARAVGGPGVDDAEAPEVREAARQLMAFVGSVFRTRRNPGAVNDASVGYAAAPEAERQEASVGYAAAPEAEPQEQVKPEIAAAPANEQGGTKEAAENAPAAHPAAEVFYRAQVAAQGETTQSETGQSVAEERKTEDVKTETVLQTHLRGQVPREDLRLRERVPFEDFEERETREGRSPAWRWVGGICALLLAFCAGLFAHQRLTMPLWARNMLHETRALQMREAASGSPKTPPPASATQPARTESAATHSVAKPAVKPSAAANNTAEDAGLQQEFMAPATIGASAELMERRLVEAPRPAYPMLAEMSRTEGKVTVEAVVAKSGRVIRAHAIGGNQLLRSAAVREVVKRRYRPYIVDGRPVDVATIVTVEFRLPR
jgi:hypothetical protein